jgi:ABC-2 type transport system ATP-binding protein
MLPRMAGMLVARGLRKRFGTRTAVDDLSFEIAPGEIYGLLGPNGAGKTTSISMLSGVLPRDAGEILVDGLDLDAGPAVRARIGLVPQSVTLYPDLSGRENLRFWGRLYDLRGSALDAAVDAALAAVGLAERADDRVAAYSGGMARRLNLAVGILHRPALLILDEPTAGVDPHSRSAIFELIERQRDAGVAVLYTTHYMEEAERLCGRIGILDEGRLVTEGTRDALVASLGREARVELGFARPGELARAAGLLAGVAGVARAAETDGRLVVFVDDGPRRMPALWARLLDAGLEPSAMALRAPDLEDVFLSLTGRALRD